MNNFTCEVGEVLCLFTKEFFTSPGFPFRLGLMIAIAIILGFVLYEDYKKLWKWLVTGLVYIVFQEWLRATYFEAAGITYTGRSAFLGLLSSTLFGLGVIAGAAIAKYILSRNYIESDRAMEIVKFTIKWYSEQPQEKTEETQN